MQDLFSNEFFEASLLKLKWEHSESATRAWETITFKEIENRKGIAILCNDAEIAKQANKAWRLCL